MVVDHRLFFGTEDGTVYAMRTDDGSVQWKFQARGAAKGGLALRDGKLYFGTYGGHVYAIGQRSGKQVWHAGTSGATFGLRAGNFYATPAVAFGRVYIGNTDGNMYSFSAATGKLAWRRKTGSYVYASPAVAQVPGTKPTVYFGSYDGTFYALDARTGGTRWAFRDGGKISGAATVVGDLVYYSNWGHRNTSALWAKSGTRAWQSERGAFNPVVSDGQTIYVTGFSSVGGLRADERRRGARGHGAAGEEAGGQEEEGRCREEEEGRCRKKKKAAAAKKKKAAAAKKKKAAAAKGEEEGCGEEEGQAALVVNPAGWGSGCPLADGEGALSGGWFTKVSSQGTDVTHPPRSHPLNAAVDVRRRPRRYGRIGTPAARSASRTCGIVYSP